MGVVVKFWSRIFWKGRRKKRLEVRVPVQVRTSTGWKEQFWTDDLSESGLRMVISSLSDLIGERRDVELGILLNDSGGPIWIIAEPIWTTRTTDGRQSSGWMFVQPFQNSHEQIMAFLKSPPS